jgi:F-type H+-transporting ATPase subunit b
MSRFLGGFLFLAALLAAAEEHDAHGGDPLLMYKWINFAILAVGLGILISRTLLPALKARSAAIARELEASRESVKQAEAQIAALEAKLKNFDAELEALRQQSASEREREAHRIAEQTKTLLAKMEAQRQLEIESATKLASHELRRFTVTEALALAEARLRTSVDAGAQGQLVNTFIEDLKKVEAPKA